MTTLQSNLLDSEAPSPAKEEMESDKLNAKKTKVPQDSTTFESAGALETGVATDGPPTSQKKKCTVEKPLIYAAIGVVLIILVAVLLGTLLPDHKSQSDASGKEESTPSPTVSPADVSNGYFEEQFLTIPSNDSCYAYSEKFASKPHVAGMTRTRELGSMFGEIMEDLGFEVFYDDIPNAVLDHYNSSSLTITTNGETVNVNLTQNAIPGQNETFTAFRTKSGVAYTPSGEITAPLIYVDYGFGSDYTELMGQFGGSFNNSGTGYIALAKRYWPNLQVKYAAMYGLKGLILFDDFYIENSSAQYPYTSALPNFAHRMDGRARESLSCPGTPDLNRLAEECGLNITNDFLFPAIANDIPMMAISPNAAIEIFEHMASVEDGNCTVGGSSFDTTLPVDACIGGSDEMMVTMKTVNELHLNDTIQNVYGYWEGEVYPDEIVMIGGHRDAWGMGACDDISGTVSVLEIARSLSVLRDDYGWRPKRSLMFGSWDGEEWGLYGSVSFNEGDNQWKDRVVSYLNFDMTVVGGALKMQGNPMYRELLLETAQEIQYPYQQWTQHNNADNDVNWTLYDSWYDFNTSDESDNSLGMIVCNTDFCPFEFHSGVPSLGINFMGDFSLATTYHTFYDLNGWMDVVDPKWDFAESIASFGGLLMLKISQEHLLPFDVVRLAMKMEEWATVDLADYLSETEEDGNCTFNSTDSAMATLEEKLGELVQAAMDFEDLYNRTETEIESADGVIADGSDLSASVSTINGVLKKVMKRLTNPDGTPASKWYKQLLWNNWGDKKFPYIWSFISDGCEDEDHSAFEEAFTITIGAINNVTALLMNAQL